jgi:hypothetical protein
MLYFDGLGGLILLGLWVFCFIDVLMTPEYACRNLPKLAWVFIVLLFSLIGSIAWLVAGRPWDRTSAAVQKPRGASGRFPEYDRPGRHVPSNPDDDDEFLAGLRKRAEEQRRRAREQSHDQDPNGPRDGETT